MRVYSLLRTIASWLRTCTTQHNTAQHSMHLSIAQAGRAPAQHSITQLSTTAQHCTTERSLLKGRETSQHSPNGRKVARTWPGDCCNALRNTKQRPHHAIMMGHIRLQQSAAAHWGTEHQSAAGAQGLTSLMLACLFKLASASCLFLTRISSSVAAICVCVIKNTNVCVGGGGVQGKHHNQLGAMFETCVSMLQADHTPWGGGGCHTQYGEAQPKAMHTLRMRLLARDFQRGSWCSTHSKCGNCNWWSAACTHVISTL